MKSINGTHAQRITLFALCVITAGMTMLISCGKKNTPTPKPATGVSVVGTWALKSIVDYDSGTAVTDTLLPCQKAVRLIFGSDNSFTVTNPGGCIFITPVTGGRYTTTVTTTDSTRTTLTTWDGSGTIYFPAGPVKSINSTTITYYSNEFLMTLSKQ